MNSSRLLRAYRACGSLALHQVGERAAVTTSNLWEGTMFRCSIVAVVFVEFILASTIALAAASGAPPKVNIEATCRTSEIEIKKIFGDDTKVTTSGCLMQENAALDELAMTWSTFSSADKASCVQPRSYMPSYVEWLTCLDTRKELRRIRAQDKATRRGLERHQPLVQLTIQLQVGKGFAQL